MKPVTLTKLAIALAAVAAAPVFADQALATAKNCMACHAVDKKVVGPSYREVAAKYAGQKDAVDKALREYFSGKVSLKTLLAKVVDLLDLARSLQQRPEPHALAGKILGLLFMNPSLRTLSSTAFQYSPSLKALRSNSSDARALHNRRKLVLGVP
jgi:cytochrome c551/c552